MVDQLRDPENNSYADREACCDVREGTMRRSTAKLAGRCGRGAQEHSPVAPSTTETGSEMGGLQAGEPEHSPVLSSHAKSAHTGAAEVRAHSRRVAVRQEQTASSLASGQPLSVVVGDNTERRARKRTAIWDVRECRSRSRYNLRAGRREGIGVRQKQVQKEFNAEIRTKRYGTSSRKVLSSTDGPGGHKARPVTEGGMIASSIAGEQASPTEETAVQVTASRPRTLAAGGTGGKRGAEIRGHLDDGAGVLGRIKLKGTSRQSHGGGVGNKGSPCDVRKDECGLEMTAPGEDVVHGSGEEIGKAMQHAIQAGTTMHSSLAKPGVRDTPLKGAATPVTSPSRTEPGVTADDDATSREPPRPEQLLAEFLNCEPEPSVADLHNVLPPTCEDQPLPWNHQLIRNLSTESSGLQICPASTVSDPCDVDVLPSVPLSDSQLNSVVLGELECDQAAGKREHITHLLCGLVTELSTLNRMVMAAHRELESLRRGRTPKLPLRRPYCPRRAEP